MSNQENKDTGMMLGYVMPQNIDAEKAVIGGVLSDRSAFRKLTLRHEAFYLPIHQIIWEAIEMLDATNKPIDSITLSTRLTSMGKLDEIGGAFYLIELQEAVFSSAHIEHHAQIILEAYFKRSLITSCTRVIQDSYSGIKTGLDISTDLISSTIDIQKQTQSKRDRNKFEIFQDLEALMERASDKGMGGIPVLGIHPYDLLVDGGQPGDVHLIPARPSMGKTALLCGALQSDIQRDIFSAAIQLEMTDVKMTRRLMSCLSGIHLDVFKSGKLDKEQRREYESAKQMFYDSKVKIVDLNSVNAIQLRAVILNLVSQGCQKIYVDHGGLIQHMGNGSDESELGKTSNMMKSTMKEAEIPGVFFLQLNREIEKRGFVKRVRMSDIRGSGRWEEDADTITGLMRPKIFYPNDTKWLRGEREYDIDTYAELQILKNREGALEDILLDYEITHFKEMDRFNH